MKHMNGLVRIALGIGLACALPSLASAVVIDLGDAADYAVLAIPDGADVPDVKFFGSVKITGDVAVGQNGSFDMNSSGIGKGVFGNVYLASGVTQDIAGGANITGSVFTNVDLSQAIADALQASMDADTLVATQTFGTITSSTTWFGNGGLNVIDVNVIDLGGSDTLTLSGSAADTFIINVATTFDMGGSSKIVTADGALPGHVLYNFPTAGTNVHMTAIARAQGTILAPYRDAHLDGDLNTGAVIANDIRFGSSGQLLYDRFGSEEPPVEPPQPAIPEPASMLLFGIGLLGAGRFARGKRP